MTQGIKKNIVTGALAFAFLGLALAACGDDGGENTSGAGGGGGSGGSGGSGIMPSYGEQFVAATCGKIFECCNAADLVERTNSVFVDYAGCRILYRGIWDGSFQPLVKDGEASGRLGFDAAAFDACIASLKGQTCAAFASNAEPFCDDIFVPKVDKGGACTLDVECKTKKCEVPTGASEGTCIDAPPPAASGQPCTADGDCMEGLYCDGVTDLCAKKRDDGAACSSNDQCLGTCVGDQNGGMGTCGKVCEGGGPGPGPIDAALEAVGGPVAIAECGRIFDCCTTEEQAALLFPGLDTEPECRGLFASFLGLALVGIHDDAAEGRVSVDAAKLAACVDAYEAIGCAEYAKGAKFECPDAIKGLVAEGQTCTENRQCVSTYCYKPGAQSMGSCAALPGAGAACTGTCAEGLYCETGTCTTKKSVGAACTASGECAESRCFGPAGMKTCTLICDGL
jgi:hypothetical protein